MDSPIVIHGGAFTSERLKEFMAEVRAMDAESKVSPHERFMDRAKTAGFSDSQAEFLWQLHIMPPPRLF